MGSRLKRRVSQGKTSNGKAESAAQWRMAFLVFLILTGIAAFCMVLIKSAATTKYNYSYIYPDEPATPAPASPPNEPGHLTDASSSADALAKRFLDGLARKDEAAMKALRISKEEFCHYIWPELPTSRIQNLSCDFAWGQATLNSEAGFYDDLARHKGKRYEIIAVRFAGRTEFYKNFTIHNDSRVKIRDEKGVVSELKLFGSMLEMNGEFKLFSFVIDD